MNIWSHILRLCLGSLLASCLQTAREVESDGKTPILKGYEITRETETDVYIQLWGLFPGGALRYEDEAKSRWSVYCSSEPASTDHVPLNQSVQYLGDRDGFQRVELKVKRADLSAKRFCMLKVIAFWPDSIQESNQLGTADEPLEIRLSSAITPKWNVPEKIGIVVTPPEGVAQTDPEVWADMIQKAVKMGFKRLEIRFDALAKEVPAVIRTKRCGHTPLVCMLRHPAMVRVLRTPELQHLVLVMSLETNEPHVTSMKQLQADGALAVKEIQALKPHFKTLTVTTPKIEDEMLCGQAYKYYLDATGKVRNGFVGSCQAEIREHFKETETARRLHHWFALQRALSQGLKKSMHGVKDWQLLHALTTGPERFLEAVGLKEVQKFLHQSDWKPDLFLLDAQEGLPQELFEEDVEHFRGEILKHFPASAWGMTGLGISPKGEYELHQVEQLVREAQFVLQRGARFVTLWEAFDRHAPTSDGYGLFTENGNERLLEHSKLNFPSFLLQKLSKPQGDLDGGSESSR